MECQKSESCKNQDQNIGVADKKRSHSENCLTQNPHDHRNGQKFARRGCGLAGNHQCSGNDRAQQGNEIVIDCHAKGRGPDNGNHQPQAMVLE
jgi:hypothetical protein